MDESVLERAVDILARARRVTVMTGAGVSAESGVPTFRGSGGLWEGRRAEDLATPEAFSRDPALVWRFYEERRRKLTTVKPNPAHRVLAAWQQQFAVYTLVTQNVDGLHAAAGSRQVLELHGNIWRVRCTGCGQEREDRTVPFPSLPPRCPACGGVERPAVVWFGEGVPVDVFEAAGAAAAEADTMVVVGTSAVVYPAAGLVTVAARAGAALIEVNPEPSAMAGHATVALRGPAGVVLPALEAQLAERQRGSVS